MENVSLVNIKKKFINIDTCHAHINNDKQKESLKNHLDLTYKYYLKLSNEKGIDCIVDNIINGLYIKSEILTCNNKELIKEMFINAIYLHDIGKINPYFQRIKMANNKYQMYQEAGDSSHSLLSSLIYIDIFSSRISGLENPSIATYLHNLLFSFAYSISRHHSYLKSPEVFTDKLVQLYMRIKRNPIFLNGYKMNSIKDSEFFDEYEFSIMERFQKKEWEYDGIHHYILSRLLFSIINACDFYATYEFMNKDQVDFGLIKNAKKLIKIYHDTKIYKGIENYKNNKDYFRNDSIDMLRSELFLEVDASLKDNIDNNIFYIEAPTGSGKTNLAINASLQLINYDNSFNKIFYIFPFNTLVGQTKEKLEEIFGGKENNARISVINSITPIISESELKENDECANWEKYLLDRQLLHYPMVITTHVNFFNYLFGTGREVSLPLSQLCNSVIVIDEIQSYKNSIWTEIIIFLEKYSKLLNMKIIIMSATLPKLDRLVERPSATFIELVKDKNKYYNHPLFKDRVKTNYELLDKGKIDEKELLDKIKELIGEKKEKRLLIEFITKNRARSFYKLLKHEFPNKKIAELSGDDNRFFRENLIKELNAKDKNGHVMLKDIILVSTQVIEAGVDIDMDIGFKNISLLDSEEQFLGRINRSSLKKNSVVYFFYIDSARKIYKNDFRLEYDLRNKEYRDYLDIKDFLGFYNNTFKKIMLKNQNLTNENMRNRLYEASMLKYSNVEKNMQLIEDNQYQIFIPYIAKVSESKSYDGAEVWKQYKSIIKNNNFGYAEKKLRLSIINEKLNNFIYSVRKIPPSYDEKFGDIYYLEKGVEFIDVEGKFDREQYFEKFGGLFI